MRFMIIRTAARQTDAGVRPSHEFLAAMSQYYTEELTNAPAWADSGEPDSRPPRARFSVRALRSADRPDTEAKEIASLALIQVESLEQAIDWARGWPAIDGDWSAEIEIRHVLETADVSPELVPALPG